MSEQPSSAPTASTVALALLLSKLLRVGKIFHEGIQSDLNTVILIMVNYNVL